MSDSVQIPLGLETWVDITTGNDRSGFVTNSGTSKVMYAEATTIPPDVNTFGHPFGPGAHFYYDLKPGGIVYARSICNIGLLTLTGHD